MQDYSATLSRVEDYFDRSATKVWERLTSDAPVSRIRQTVREGRDRMRAIMLSRLPADLRGCRVLDAGCGTGDGLRELRAAYPQADVEGVEWSRPLAWLARWRARGARVRRGDLWADDWAPFALVYVFQRPESMPRVWAKACAEMAPGAWLVSLDFAVPEVAPAAQWQLPHGQYVRVYRVARNVASKPAK